MTMFYSMPRGSALRLDAIRSIGNIEAYQKPDGSLDSRQEVLVDGEAGPRRFAAYQVEQLLKTPIQILPAEPGSMLVHVDTSSGETPYVHKVPLIMWALCVDGRIRPVTPAGVDDDTGEPSVGWWMQMPSTGQFYAACGAFDVDTFATEADLIVWAGRFCRKPDNYEVTNTEEVFK